MKVAQVMQADVELSAPDDNLAAAASRMWDADIGCLPVVSADGRVVGMVTNRDICMAALTCGQALHQVPVSVAMSQKILFCSPQARLMAEEIMRSGQVRRLPVIDSEGNLAGIVSLNDLARLAGREMRRKNSGLSAQELTVTLAAISAPRQNGDKTANA